MCTDSLPKNSSKKKTRNKKWEKKKQQIKYIWKLMEENQNNAYFEFRETNISPMVTDGGWTQQMIMYYYISNECRHKNKKQKHCWLGQSGRGCASWMTWISYAIYIRIAKAYAHKCHWIVRVRRATVFFSRVHDATQAHKYNSMDIFILTFCIYNRPVDSWFCVACVCCVSNFGFTYT